HHAVLAGLPRADSVEEPNDNRGQFLFSPIGEGQELINRFRTCVAPAPLVGGAYHQVIFFTEREFLALAVNLGGRSDQHCLSFFGRMLEQQLGGPNVRLNSSAGRFDDQPDTYSGGEVKDHVGLIYQFGEKRAVHHRIDHEMKARIAAQVLYVFDRARRQVIENGNYTHLVEQSVSQVRSDEASSARDQTAHNFYP